MSAGAGRSTSKINSAHHVWCLGAPWRVSLPPHSSTSSGLSKRPALLTSRSSQGSQASLYDPESGSWPLLSPCSRKPRGKLQGLLTMSWKKQNHSHHILLITSKSQSQPCFKDGAEGTTQESEHETHGLLGASLKTSFHTIID